MDSEEQRIQSLDDRFGKIESEQERQGGLLEDIRGMLGGKDRGDTGKDAPAPDRGEQRERPGMIQEQMAEAIRKVRAEEKQQEADAAHAADHASLKDKAPEKAPREATGWKERLQGRMFGAQS